GNLNCLTCHSGDEPDDEDHPKGQQCSDCHDTKDWDDVNGSVPSPSGVNPVAQVVSPRMKTRSLSSTQISFIANSVLYELSRVNL
ncbi:MAG: hypothetical protein HC806_00950, partial [Anaerolineae bacterium]|nr:hypothetical protein [Anaerolineae bacterium]